MLDFVYKGNAYSLFYSKTNDEVPVVDIKGCQLENKNSFGFWGANEGWSYELSCSGEIGIK